MVWENDNNGRQRWCTRMVLGGGFASPLFDGFDNLYVGQPGLMLSFPPTQWVRWRTPVIGMPTTPRFLGAGQLLVVTHLGQVLVFDSHRGDGDRHAAGPGRGRRPHRRHRGLTDCQPARPALPGRLGAGVLGGDRHLVVPACGSPDAPAPVLTGLRYQPGQTRC